MPIKIVTLNLLADLSHWEARRPLLVKGLADLQPDFLALQEANLQIRNAEWLSDCLGMPYCYVSPKTGSAGSQEGIAMLSRLPFENQDTLDLLTQSRVAQMVQVRVGGRPLVLANGHFYWQPGEAPERVQQVERLKAWLAEHASSGKQVPVIVCGDFNATPRSESITHMLHGFRSAYAAIHSREPEYTTPTPLSRAPGFMLFTIFQMLRYIRWSELRLDWKGTLDYIFVNDAVQVVDCQLVLNQPAPENPKIYPSDHFGLMATLEI